MDALPWPDLPPAAAGAIGALLGLCAGSFLATLVVRWPRGEGLGGRSRCDGCGAAIGTTDLIPLLGWLRLGGRARCCGSRIDPLHPAMEAAGAAIGALALAAVPGPQGLSGALLGWTLMALAALDRAHFWLPDRLTLPLLAAGLLLGPAAFPERALAAALGGGGLFALALGFRAATGREGLGLGDVKLMAALGAWLSPVLLPPLLLGAALIGLAFAGVRRLRGPAADNSGADDAGAGGAGAGGADSDGRVPFGACLALAGFPLWLAANAPAALLAGT